MSPRYRPRLPQVGDLIRCAEETAVVIDVTWTTNGALRPSSVYPHVLWLECLWSNGDIEGVDHDDVEVVSESR
jgi:hypothetical protein